MDSQRGRLAAGAAIVVGAIILLAVGINIGRMNTPSAPAVSPPPAAAPAPANPPAPAPAEPAAATPPPAAAAAPPAPAVDPNASSRVVRNVSGFAPLGDGNRGDFTTPAMTVVSQFYQDLEREDVGAASAFIVPDRRIGTLSASSLGQYFSTIDNPLRLEDVRQLSAATVQARYSYTAKSGASCEGVSDSTLTQRGGELLILKIAAREVCGFAR